MNQEWYSTSTVIVQTAIVFITSTFDLLKTQIRYFIKVAVTLLFCTTKRIGQGCHFCKRNFARKENPEFNKDGRVS